MSFYVVQEVKTPLRHAAVVAFASLLAFLVVPYITRLGYSFNTFTENLSVDGVGAVTSLLVELVWLVLHLHSRGLGFNSG